MQKLWSPWRSQYIDSFKREPEKENACVFCEAVKEKTEDDKSIKVYDGDKVFIMLNLYPYNNGHLLVIPKRHLSDLSELTDEETAEAMKLVKKSVEALKITLKPQGFNFGANLGKAAGAGIADHLHFHIVPRWNGDTNFMPALGEIKVISQDLLVTKNNLIEAFHKIL